MKFEKLIVEKIIERSEAGCGEYPKKPEIKSKTKEEEVYESLKADNFECKQKHKFSKDPYLNASNLYLNFKKIYFNQ